MTDRERIKQIIEIALEEAFPVLGELPEPSPMFVPEWSELEKQEEEVVYLKAEAALRLHVEEAVKEIVEEREQLRRLLNIAEAKLKTSLANNLCSDHRDKQAGKTCLACEVERLKLYERAIASLAGQILCPATSAEELAKDILSSKSNELKDA